MDLAVIQIQALVKQTQSQYLMAFALKIGQRLIGPSEQMETAEHGEFRSGFEILQVSSPFLFSI